MTTTDTPEGLDATAMNELAMNMKAVGVDRLLIEINADGYLVSIDDAAPLKPEAVAEAASALAVKLRETVPCGDGTCGVPNFGDELERLEAAIRTDGADHGG